MKTPEIIRTRTLGGEGSHFAAWCNPTPNPRLPLPGGKNSVPLPTPATNLTPTPLAQWAGRWAHFRSCERLWVHSLLLRGGVIWAVSPPGIEILGALEGQCNSQLKRQTRPNPTRTPQTHPHPPMPIRVRTEVGPLGKRKNELVSDTKSFLPARQRQACGWGQERVDTMAILAQGTCYV